MSTSRKTLAMALVTLIAAASLLAAAGAAPLAAERWNKRVVVVFAQSGNAEEARQTEALLADREALGERDMLVIRVVGDAVSVPFGTLSPLPGAQALREAYQVAEDAPFTMILLGKDGGEKLRRTEPVPARDVLGLIDSMPMRRREAGG